MIDKNSYKHDLWDYGRDKRLVILVYREEDTRSDNGGGEMLRGLVLEEIEEFGVSFLHDEDDIAMDDDNVVVFV